MTPRRLRFQEPTSPNEHGVLNRSKVSKGARASAQKTRRASRECSTKPRQSAAGLDNDNRRGGP